jgi:hypothetical protein
VDKIRLVSYFFIILFISSCQQTGKEDKIDEVSSIILDEEIDDINTDSERTVYYRFPSPEDMLQYINREKLDYLPDLLNPHGHSKKYMGSTSQAINLGVYISELAYVIIFKKLNHASNYLDAVNYLSDELLISPKDNSALESRVKRNLNNIDSLTVISRDAYNDMVTYLANTNNEQTLALISTGAYIEALYLALNQIDEFNPDNPLIKKIFEQQYALSNLYQFLNENSGGNNTDILAELKDVKSKLDQIKIVKTSETEVTQEDGMLVFGGGETKVQITESQFEDVKKSVSRVRKKFVRI